MEENTTEQPAPRKSLIAEDSPLRKMTAEELLLQLEELMAAYWNIKIQEGKIEKQNNLLQETLVRVIGAVKVLEGGKGHGVFSHVINIVQKTIGRIKTDNYIPQLEDCLWLVKSVQSDADLTQEAKDIAAGIEKSLFELENAIHGVPEYPQTPLVKKIEFDN